MGRGTVARARALLALALVASWWSAAPGAQAGSLESPLAVPGEALVRFLPGTAPGLRAAVHAAAGARTAGVIPAIGFERVRLHGGAVERALAAYRAHPAVAAAEPNYRGRIALPSDACLTTPCDGAPGQWHWALNNAAFGWDLAPAAAPVTIAILDTKIDASHPDLAGRVDLAGARDFVPASRQNGAAAYHGTFVAGLAAAATGNAIDVAGAAPGARILPVTVVDGGGNTDAATLAEAIVHAWRAGARVLNLSLGILGDSAAVRDAIRMATAGDARTPPALVVAAAGNNTGAAPFYPGSYPETMSVAGTDAADGRAPCSNHNGNVSVSAPADRLVGLAPMPGRRTQAPCGTSAAAPQVSGLGALLFMQDPSRTPAQVRELIESSADDLGAPGRDDHFGAGRINAERALRGAGPRVRALQAGVAAPGGSSALTARADTRVVAAQVVFDRPDAPPVAMTVGGGGTGLSVTLAVPAGIAPGPHPVWVRAFDGAVWGAASAGVVYVDGRAPSIAAASASDAVRATGTPMSIRFTATDDAATTLSFGVEVRSTATNAIVFRGARFDVAAGGQRYDWLPSLDVPAGHYRMKVAVADPSGNVSSTEVGALVA